MGTTALAIADRDNAISLAHAACHELGERFRHDASALAEFLGDDLRAWSVFADGDDASRRTGPAAQQSAPQPAAPGTG